MPNPSPSEFALFQKLANPNKTDFSRRAAAQNPFQRAVQSQFQHGAKSNVSRHSRHSRRSPRSRSSSSRSSSRSRRSSRSSRSSRGSRGSGGGGGGGRATFQMPDVETERETSEEVNLEKQGYLLELMKFKGPPYNIKLTREYTMDDSLGDIQFEYDRIKSNLTTTNNVALIRDTLGFVFMGIESANHKWGPILQLDGWADSVMEDRQRYDHVLERLYKKHWRLGNMSPEAEFGWLIGSSMVKHHLKMKMSGGKLPDKPATEGGGAKGPKFNLGSMLGMVMNGFGGGGGGGLGGMLGGGGRMPPPPMVHSAPPTPVQHPNHPNAPHVRPVMRPPSSSASSFIGKDVPMPRADFTPGQHVGQGRGDAHHQPQVDVRAQQEIRALREQLDEERRQMSQMQSAMRTMRDDIRVNKQTQEQMERVVRNTQPPHPTPHPPTPLPPPRVQPPPPAPQPESDGSSEGGVESSGEQEEDDKQVSITGGMKRGGGKRRVGLAAGAAAGARKPVTALKLDL